MSSKTRYHTAIDEIKSSHIKLAGSDRGYIKAIGITDAKTRHALYPRLRRIGTEYSYVCTYRGTEAETRLRLVT